MDEVSMKKEEINFMKSLDITKEMIGLIISQR